ncbi:universal stress protein [Halomicrobium katesii]|uniref:universal stress protein n=1 Tax=Halomicrobium katesii TaxID=437163 RepID=UPI00036F2ACB|nr:universal stress protein [Halomicrobium katesii]
MYETILVPTDGSDHADRAFDSAVALADRADSSLALLHVVDTGTIGEPALSTTELVVGQREDDGTALLKRLAQRARDRGIGTQLHNCHGEPSREIRSYADEIEADLVVMGYQGRDHDRTLGTVTAQVVKACERPVMLV